MKINKPGDATNFGLYSSGFTYILQQVLSIYYNDYNDVDDDNSNDFLSPNLQLHAIIGQYKPR